MNKRRFILISIFGCVFIATLLWLIMRGDQHPALQKALQVYVIKLLQLLAKL
ncbi:hypothetical protein [Acinetobacter pittii]|uniref:hypothetical protein n=1 Tax=Acinetobacter pittii TaxID=48296 RepID=UPI000A835C5D|nr:hypothetical protein [Acinetobacter pittii]